MPSRPKGRQRDRERKRKRSEADVQNDLGWFFEDLEDTRKVDDVAIDCHVMVSLLDGDGLETRRAAEDETIFNECKLLQLKY